MRTTLATATLEMPADQSLLVKDIYEIEGTENNTSVVDVLKDVGSDLAKVIRTTPNMTQKLLQLNTEAMTGRLTKENALRRVTQMLGGTNDVLGKLKGKLNDTLTNTFGMDPKLTNQVLTVIKDSVTGLNTYHRGPGGMFGNMSNASEVTRAIQGVLGNKDLIESLDLGAEAALAGELINQAVRAGIPTAIDVLLRNASNDYNRQYIISRNMAPILFSGDVATLENILNYTSPSVVGSIRPTFASDFLANLRLPYGTPYSDYPDIKSRVLSILDSIDPSWHLRMRDGELIATLIPFVRMSKDAKEIFLTSEAYRLQATIASKFGDTSMAKIIRAQYPYFPI